VARGRDREGHSYLLGFTGRVNGHSPDCGTRAGTW
jgi:hypothetical protein